MIRGERLKQLRKEKGLNQDKLAEIFGVKKSTICTYEKERRKPPYDMIQKYMEYFGVTSDYLLGMEKLGIKEEKEPFNYFAITDNEAKFLNLLKKEPLIYEILINDPKRGMDLLKRKIG